MNTRITDLHRALSRDVEAVGAARPATAVDPVAAPSGSGQTAAVDRVSLSSQARALAAQSRQEEATEKVARLREAVQSGTLAVDAHAIAAKLLGE